MELYKFEKSIININAKKMMVNLFLLCFFLLLFSNAYAADVKGSSDHAMVSRFPGSVIKAYKYDDFDEYKIPTANNYKSSNPVEGKVTKIRYSSKADDSPAKIFRSYGKALKKAGFTETFKCSGHKCGFNILEGVGRFSGGGARGDDCRYNASELVRDEGNVYVSLLVCDWYDSPVVGTWLHIIEAEPLEGGLIKVDAEALQKDILAEGHAALYGVYFDTNKASLKPESKPTLAEVKKLLTNNPKLKLLIVGHTDNIGKLAYNVNLSNGRAKAVVKALVSDYGISASRLTAFGAGMYAPVASNNNEAGRLQNRRVELVQR